jgi:methanol metabolism-related c-type cytochrome
LSAVADDVAVLSIHLAETIAIAASCRPCGLGDFAAKTTDRLAAAIPTLVKAFGRHNLVTRTLFCLGACAAAIAWTLAPTPASAQDAEKPYSVVDGKVDKATYNGYRRYHASCHTCHGPDGLGSSYAPNLVDSLKVIDYDQFAEVVINGRENVTGTQKNVMPAFGTVEDVALYLDDIYAYLKARSDDAIGRGRPARQ